MKMSGNTHLPPEAVLKWVIKQRDEFAAKLEQLIGYTKALELRCSELEEQKEEYKRKLKKIRDTATDL